jgi:transcriptional regulator with XRE-family HTH domain
MEVMTMMEKLERLMALHGHSGRFLEEEMKWPKARISKWKHHSSEPSASQIFKLARYYGVSVDYLMDDSLDTDPRHIEDWEVQVLKVARRLGENETMDRLFVGRLELRSLDSRVNEFRALDPSKQLEAGGGVDPPLIKKPRRA